MKVLPTRSLASNWVCKFCEAHLWRNTTPVSLRRKYATPAGQKRLPDGPARTRFAPSPTGHLHLGSIRTALYNYLLAKRTKGQFLLRIEDTDQKRTVLGAEQRLYKDLQWAGLQWDEGIRRLETSPVVGGPYDPYRQSERTPTYHYHARTLLESNHAYRCFCSAQRIEELHASQHNDGTPLGYDRHCLGRAEEESEELMQNGQAHVVRFKAPQHYPKYNDFVFGKSGHGIDKGHKLHIDHPIYDDPILIKSDGNPTYHFANVVDDHLMRITHVIRGSEWMSSTPLHVALYQAFGWEVPSFGHVPLLVDTHGAKLSKRNLDTDIQSFDTQGVLPAALMNFAALLGWSHQQKSDVMDLQELEAVFDLRFTRGNTIVDLAKLDFLQARHAERYARTAQPGFQQMVNRASDAIRKRYSPDAINRLTSAQNRSLKDLIAIILRADPKSYQSLSIFVNKCATFFSPLIQDTSAYTASSSDVPTKSLTTAAAALCFVPEQKWTAAVHQENLTALQPPDSPLPDSLRVVDQTTYQKVWKRELYRYLRWALLGVPSGPGLAACMEILGRTECVDRIAKAGKRIQRIQQGDIFAERPDRARVFWGGKWEREEGLRTVVGRIDKNR